ncbi:hypothetical protein [Streptomyces poriticola]|uniref:hypothetical protein n=1 Tax=Streptomyces poriticola TaxID=3120506 RepID=UPI002FCE2F9C
MAGHPQPRRITLGGREAVALTVAEYEQLVASRRQTGGQSARVRILSERMRRTERLLRDLEDLVAAPADARPGQSAGAERTEGPAPEAGGAAAVGERDADSLRRAIAVLLRRHREQAP